VLWFDMKRERYFWIPEDTELPEGGFELRAFRGGRKEVDPAALVEREITREEAAEHIDAEIQGTWTRARGAFQTLIDFGREKAVEAGADISDADVKNPLPENLGERLGVSLGEMQTNPGAVKAKIREAIGEVKVAARGFSEKAAEASDEASDKASGASDEPYSFEEAAKAAADKAPEQVAEVAEKLKAALKDPKLASAIQTMSERLGELAERLREPPTEDATQNATQNTTQNTTEPAEE